MNAKRGIHGQGLLEFALVLPMLIFLMVAFIELARIIYFYSALNNAVREGARYAIVNHFDDSADREEKVRQTVAQYAIALSLNPDDITVYCDRNSSDTDYPCDTFVTVAADIEIEPMVGFFAQFIGGSNTYNITADSTMQMTPYGVSD
jgi:Flp pilus assembly protein TadG